MLFVWKGIHRDVFAPCGQPPVPTSLDEDSGDVKYPVRCPIMKAFFNKTVKKNAVTLDLGCQRIPKITLS
jgi:hypothetical protein